MKISDGLKRYRLSFTAGGLLRHETIRLASLWLEVRNWDKIHSLVFDENVLQFKSENTRRRVFPEMRGRIETLNENEIKTLTSGTVQDEDQLLWLALCRRYDFIADFARQVLREHFLTCRTTVDYADYDYFVEQASILHPELHEIKTSTYERLRAALFCIMRDCSFLDEKGTIRPTLLSDAVTDILKNGNPAEIGLFPTLQKVI